MADNLELALKIKALVEGLKNVESLTNEVEALGKQAGVKLPDPTDDLDKGAKDAAQSMEGLRRSVLALGAAIAGGALAKSFLNTAKNAERFAIQLETIEGSAEAAQASLGWIREFTKETPYSLAEVTAAFTKLKAYGIDPTDGALRSLGDTASAMGKPLEQAVEALADAMTGEYERLKEFGIKARTEGDVVRFHYVKNGEQMVKAAQNASQESIKATLEAIWNDRYGGGMAKFQSSWQGMTSNLGDMWAQFQNQVMDAGVFDAMKDALEDLLEQVNEAARSGELKEWAESVAAAVKALIEGIGSLTSFLAENREVIAELVKIYGVYRVMTSQLVRSTLDFGKALMGMAASAKAAEAATAKLNATLKAAGWATIAVQVYNLSKATIDLANDWNTAAEQMRQSREDTAAHRKEMAAFYDEITQRTGVVVQNIDDLRRANQEGTLVLDKTTKQWVLAADAIEKTAAASEKAVAPASAQAEALDRNAIAARELADKFTEAAAAAEEADSKVRELVAGIDLTSADSVAQLGQAMGMLHVESKGTAQAVRDQLMPAIQGLDAAQLQQFSAALQSSYQSGMTGGQALADMNTMVLQASFDALGLSAETALGRISPAAQEAITSLRTIRETLETAADGGEAKMEALGDAVAAALDSADTIASVEALKDEIEDMGRTGELAGKALKQAMLGVKQRMDTLTPGIQSVEEAYRQLGLVSQAEMKKVAKASREAYEVIKSANAPIGDQKAAWVAYAEAAIEANGGVATSALKTEAKILGLTEELNDLTGAQEKASGATEKAARSLDKQGEAADRTSKKIDKVAKSTEKAAKAAKDAEKNKPNERAGGDQGPMTITDMDQAYGEYMKSRSGPRYGRRWYENAMRDWNKMNADEKSAWHPRNEQNRTSILAQAKAGREPQREQPAIAPVKTVRMELSLAGKQHAFDVPEGQESAVEALMRDLEAGASTAQ